MAQAERQPSLKIVGRDMEAPRNPKPPELRLVKGHESSLIFLQHHRFEIMVKQIERLIEEASTGGDGLSEAQEIIRLKINNILIRIDKIIQQEIRTQKPSKNKLFDQIQSLDRLIKEFAGSLLDNQE